jgi:hypothetical protein
MKRFVAVVVFVCVAGGGVWAEGLEFSGLLDSTVLLGAGAGDRSGFIYGLEEYAAIRMQAKLRDGAAFYGALNLSSSSGAYAQAGARLAGANAPFTRGLSPSALVVGENYLAALELERLYFRLNGDYLDCEAGLMRMAFGYGLVFGPMDFLNPRNPLRPEARPRALLGVDLAYYPADALKFRALSAAARDPFADFGAGTLVGLAGEYHGGRLSLQGLYVYESPHDTLSRGLHRFGLSLKGDLVLGLAAEALYTYDPQAAFGPAGDGLEGLALSLGFDYAFLDGDLYVLAEYLYRGGRSAGALGSGGNQYLYASGLYRLNDYTGLGLGLMAALDDLSFTPVVTAEYEVFQAFTLIFNCQVPLPPGGEADHYVQSTLTARLRF